jgi:hypothetical protein
MMMVQGSIISLKHNANLGIVGRQLLDVKTRGPARRETASFSSVDSFLCLIPTIPSSSFGKRKCVTFSTRTYRTDESTHLPPWYFLFDLFCLSHRLPSIQLDMLDAMREFPWDACWFSLICFLEIFAQFLFFFCFHGGNGALIQTRQFQSVASFRYWLCHILFSRFFESNLYSYIIIINIICVCVCVCLSLISNANEQTQSDQSQSSDAD